MSETKIIFLGTGTPNPVPERSGPAVAIIVNDNSYIIDAGTGIVRQAEMARRKYKEESLKASNLKKCFITHLHSDYTLGLADLIFTPWVLERDSELEIYGPKGINDMVENISKAYKIDIDGRLNGMEPINDIGYKTIVSEIEKEGLIYEDENVKIEAIGVNHMPFEAYGYKIATPDKTIVISGDTAPNQALIDSAKDCDILIHEVFSSQGLKSRSMEWVMYHSISHTSSIDLGKVAKAVNPKKLVLYHQLFMVEPYYDEELLEEREDEMIAEIRNNYDGEIISANDLDLIK